MTYLMMIFSCLSDQTLYPFSGALVCVWDTMAMLLGEPRRGLSVQFHNVQLHEQPRLFSDKLLRLSVQLHKGNGYFEVTSYTNFLSTSTGVITKNSFEDHISGFNSYLGMVLSVVDLIYAQVPKWRTHSVFTEILDVTKLNFATES